MPEPGRLAEHLGRLLPERVRREIYEPALGDLLIEARRRGGRPRLAVLVLFLDCLRVAVLPGPPRPAATGAPVLRPPSPESPVVLLVTELRHAFRRLVHEPGFATAAVLTLALAIGLNVAVFAVFEAVVLRPLPYADADRLVVLQHRDRPSGVTKDFIAIGDFVDIAARQRSLSGLASYGGAPVTIYGEGEAFQAKALLAGPGLLEVLGSRPTLGRGLTPDDHLEGAADVALLGHRLWQERFGGDPAAVGRSLAIGDTRFTVVGIAPPGLAFPPGADADVVLPTSLPVEAPEERKAAWTFAVGRVAAEGTAESVTSELGLLSRQMEVEHPEQNIGSEYRAVPLRDHAVGGTKKALVLLLAAVGFVMLIACVNVANLLLARALARRRETSVRLALGAGRGRVVTQFLSESLAIALTAGAIGTLLAHQGARALVALVPPSARAPGLQDVHLNAPVLGFALLLSLIAAAGLGLLAAVTVRLEDAGGVFVSAGRASAGRGTRRATFGLVAAEIALALVLLLGAGLVLKSFSALLAVDPGFRTEGVWVAEIQLPAHRYRDVDARLAFHRAFHASLLAQPAVDGVGAAVVTPLTGNNWTAPFDLVDRPTPPGDRPPDVGWQSATGGYFAAMGIPLLSGRLFDERDGPGSPPTAIVSRAIEERFFPGESALGRRIALGGPDGSEIVGVVGDIRRAGLTDEPREDLYLPAERFASPQITYFASVGEGEPGAIAGPFRNALLALEPDAVVLSARSMEDVARDSVGVANLLLWLLGIFSTSALVLAAIGIYGVMSYRVRQRTKEIGTRIAVGATGGDILRLVLGDGVRVASAGVGAGLLIGVLAARTLEGTLFGVSSADPGTIVGVTLVLVSITLLASVLPARRAASVDAARTLGQS